MTKFEIKKILRNYAQEDLKILEDNGCSAITGTKHGCLHNTFINGIYTIVYDNQKYMFQSPDRECVIEFFMDSYKIA